MILQLQIFWSRCPVTTAFCVTIPVLFVSFLVLVCCDAPFPAKSMVPPPYPVILRRLRHLIVYLFDPCAVLPFLPISFLSPPPLAPSVSVLFVSVVSSLIHQLDVGLLVFCLLLALCLYPLLFLLHSVWSSFDVLTFVHQRDIS